MKYLTIREEYTDSQGEKKTGWNKIGILFKGSNGKEYIKLHHIPDTLIHIYEKPLREEQKEETGF